MIVAELRMRLQELWEAGVEILEPATVTRFMPDEDQAVAYVIRANITRRQLSGDQLAELRERQKELATALRAQDKSQDEVGRILGVDRKTIDRWESSGKGSSGQAPNATAADEPPDLRVKLKPEHYDTIYARAQAGETHEQIAADELEMAK
jgi:hypothetical protein